MHVTWYRSATVEISSRAGTRVLCDPWMTDGAFIGSWYHWPPLEGHEFDFLVEQAWDAVYISHFHADHFDRRLLAALARNQPGLRVIIPEYSNKWLRRAVLNCGISSDNLLESASHKTVRVGDMSIRVLVADYCNPQICGASISCGGTPRNMAANDSLALFEADGRRVLNANDALAVHTAQRLWPLIGPVDLLLGHFGGAGPYPQCFEDMSGEQKLREARRLGSSFLTRLIDTADRLKARFTLPYAGQYVLSGSLSDLNDYRSILSMDEVHRKIEESGVSTPVSLEPFATFDLSRETSTREWKEPSRQQYEGYITEISGHLFPYQMSNEQWPEGEQILLDALANVKTRFNQFVASGGVGSNASIHVGANNFGASINFGHKQCSITDVPLFENVTNISAASPLLRRLLHRRSGYKGFTPYHFNQAEIGSHLTWTRVGPYPQETHFLNYLQSYD